MGGFVKRVIAVILLLLVAFSFVSCTEETTGSNETQTKENSTNEITSKIVDENLLTVDVTIPKSFFSDEDPASDELTEEQKKDGFKSAKINDDGSVTYTIKKSSWKKLIEQYKKETSELIDSITQNSEEFPSIKKITYNDDFSKIVLEVNRSEYEGSSDSFAALSIYMTVSYYQIFNQQEVKCQFAYKDVKTGEVFDTETYPDALDE